MISFVYFDIGGVALLDFSGTHNWNKLKHELGITPELNEQFETLWQEYDKRLCIDLSTSEVTNDLKQKLGLALPDNYDLLEAFVSKFARNTSIWPVVSEVQHNVPVGLLTNMYVGMYDSIKQHNLLPNIAWDVVVESAKVKLQKPDQAIFEYATKMADVPKGEILFIDNTQRHIDGAMEYGWQTLLYDPSDLDASNKALLKYFRSYL